MPEPTFWHIQSNPDVSLGRKKVIDILEKTSLIGLNFEKGSSTYNNFKDRMQLGDIVLVRDGIQPIALVEVTGKWEQKINPDEDLDWFSQRRKIRVLEYARAGNSHRRCRARTGRQARRMADGTGPQAPAPDTPL